MHYKGQDNVIKIGNRQVKRTGHSRMDSIIKINFYLHFTESQFQSKMFITWKDFQLQLELSVVQTKSIPNLLSLSA